MRNCIYILSFFLFVAQSFSQKRSNVKCGFFGNKTVEERNEAFPFNESQKIVLISYPNEESIVVLDDNENEINSTKDSLFFTKLGFKIEREFSFQLNDSSTNSIYDATKVVVINQGEIDELSDWLINYDFKIKNPKKPIELSIASCYTPRNAIVFLNENNKVISILEICFECFIYSLKPDPNNYGRTLGVDCDEKLNYFRKLFERKDFKLK